MPALFGPYLPAEWKWVLCQPAPSNVEFKELITAYGRHITFRADGVTDAQFSMHGESDEAALISELATDLIIYRTEQGGSPVKMYRGRVVTETDDVMPNNHYCNFSTVDYRGMLENRFIGIAGRSFDTVDVGLIAWTLINESQTLTAGNWGVTDGAGATASAVHTQTYGASTNIQEALNNLGRRHAKPFEWSIDANMAFNRYYPTRGSATGAALDLGGVVTHVRKALSRIKYGNAGVFTGDGIDTVPIRLVSPTLATDPTGLFEFVGNYPELKVQSSLDDRGAWEMDQRVIVRPDWVVRLAPGRWNYATMNLGDTVKFTARTKNNRINVNALHRITEVNAAVDDDGVEDIQLGLVLP